MVLFGMVCCRQLLSIRDWYYRRGILPGLCVCDMHPRQQMSWCTHCLSRTKLWGPGTPQMSQLLLVIIQAIVLCLRHLFTCKLLRVQSCFCRCIIHLSMTYTWLFEGQSGLAYRNDSLQHQMLQQPWFASTWQTPRSLVLQIMQNFWPGSWSHSSVAWYLCGQLDLNE